MPSAVPGPVCFVIMPFGTKPDPSGGPDIDFDAIFEGGIRPGIEGAGLSPVRADQEELGGIIHKAMYERLLLCDFVVVDMTTANPNVFYELGVRHTARPNTTLPIYAKAHRIPFDVNMVRALPYELDAGNIFGPAEAMSLTQALSARLVGLRELALRENPPDSPLFQLIGEYRPAAVAHLRPDVFHDRVRYAEQLRTRIRELRTLALSQAPVAIDELRRLEADLGSFDATERGVLVDVMLAYRAAGGWSDMISLYARLPVDLQRSVLVREQYAFALNRSAANSSNPAVERAQAVDVLEGIISEHGASSETCGLLGRIFKDQWEAAAARGEHAGARGYLRKAIDMYRRGFNTDIRDFYPGINLLTLLEIDGRPPAIAEQQGLYPVVRYAAERRAGATPDYWDHATLLELAVLAREQAAAEQHLSSAISEITETFQPQTTHRNLSLICAAREARGEVLGWSRQIIDELRRLFP